MRLFTLFINYKSGNHYCGVYPSLEYLYGVVCALADDYDAEIDINEIPELSEIRMGIDGNSEDFYQGFSNGMWIHVQETAGTLVEIIKEEYAHEEDEPQRRGGA